MVKFGIPVRSGIWLDVKQVWKCLHRPKPISIQILHKLKPNFQRICKRECKWLCISNHYRYADIRSWVHQGQQWVVVFSLVLSSQIFMSAAIFLRWSWSLSERLSHMLHPHNLFAKYVSITLCRILLLSIHQLRFFYTLLLKYSTYCSSVRYSPNGMQTANTNSGYSVVHFVAHA